MPHQPSSQQNNGVTKVSFCSVSLTKDRRVELRKWADECTGDNVLEYLTDLAMDGYRISVKSEDKGYSASISSTGRSGSKGNNDKVLMERGSTAERALKRAIWAHLEVFERKWATGADIDDDW